MKLKEYIRKHRMKYPLIIYIAILILSVILVSNYGGALSYVFFFVALLYVPVSLLVCFITSQMIHIYQDMEGRLLYKNISKPYQIVIKNAGFIPSGKLRLVATDDISDYRDDFTQDTYYLMPGERIEINTEITCRYAGNYTPGVVYIILQDLFGLFELKIPIKALLRVSVLPVVTDLAVNDINKMLSDDFKSRVNFVLDKEDDNMGNDMRKYEPGDPLSRIHWKNYARTGEMFVRTPEMQSSVMVKIVLVSEERTGELDYIKMHDHYLEYMISIADYFAKQKKPVQFIYYKSGIQTYIIDDIKSFRKFYLEECKDITGDGLKREKLPAEMRSDYARLMYLREEDSVLSFE